MRRMGCHSINSFNFKFKAKYDVNNLFNNTTTSYQFWRNLASKAAVQCMIIVYLDDQRDNKKPFTCFRL